MSRPRNHTRALVRELMAEGHEFNSAANRMQEFAEELESELDEERQEHRATLEEAGRAREAADAMTATFHIDKLHDGSHRLTVTTPNGDCAEFRPRGEHAERVLRDSYAALRIAPGSAGNGVPLKVPKGANGQAISDSQEESGTSSNLGAAPIEIELLEGVAESMCDVIETPESFSKVALPNLAKRMRRAINNQTGSAKAAGAPGAESTAALTNPQETPLRSLIASAVKRKKNK